MLAEPGRDAFYFLIFNANKKSVTIDLKSAAGKKLVLDLASKADVFVENFAPGAIERLGLGYDVIAKINPGIIYAQVKGFGDGSPFAGSLAFDMIAQATGGVISISGEPDGQPIKPGPTLGDTGTGMLLCISILGALHAKKRTGGPACAGGHAGCHAALHPPRLRHAGAQGRAGQAGGCSDGVRRQPPCGIFKCKGGGPNDYVYVYTSRANPKHWKRLLQVVGREELIGDKRYETPAARAEREEEVNAIVSACKHEAMRIIGAAGIPAGAVLDTKELAEDRTFHDRGILQTMDHPQVKGYVMPTWPVRHNGAPVAVKAAPMLGQHSAKVLARWLGLSVREIEGLAADKIITQRK